MNPFKYSILFDANYIEPAIVTAFSILKCEPFRKVQLIWVINGEDTNDASQLLARFQEFGKGNIEVVTLSTKLLPSINFRRAHFNETIILKILLPALLPSDEPLVLLDAGMIPQRKYWFLSQKIDSLIFDSNGTYVVAANVLHPSLIMPASLLEHLHCAQYPAGQLLVFNVKNYREMRFENKILTLFDRHKESLLLAEQELLCLASEPSQIFPLDADFWLPFLSTKGFDINIQKIHDAHINSHFMKFVGPFKPWHYSCLDPLKVIFLRWRYLLEDVFTISNYQCINRSRSLSPYPHLIQESNESYCKFLSMQFSADPLSFHA